MSARFAIDQIIITVNPVCICRDLSMGRLKITARGMLLSANSSEIVRSLGHVVLLVDASMRDGICHLALSDGCQDPHFTWRR